MDDFNRLLVSAETGEIDIVLAALSQKPELIHESGVWGNNLLHQASRGGQLKLVKSLLNRNANVNARSNMSWDALMCASSQNHITVVNLLLEKGANPCSGDGYKTALGLAAENGYHEVCLLLLSKGADLMAIHNRRTVLSCYQRRASLNPPEQSIKRAEIEKAWYNGPHPSQRWIRRLPIMLFITGCRFRPLAGKQGWIPPEGLIQKQKEGARRRTLVFSSDVLLRLIVSFL
jgi:hypothetical protein